MVGVVFAGLLHRVRLAILIADALGLGLYGVYGAQKALLAEVGGLLASMDASAKALEKAARESQATLGAEAQAAAYRDRVTTALVRLRGDVDALEALLPADLWPVPPYSELLFKL